MRNARPSRVPACGLAIVAILTCGALLLPAAEPPEPDINKLFEAVAAYKFGQDEKPLTAVAELVRRSYKDPKRRRAIEDRLVKLLATGTDDCKRFVCRQLWMAASARSVGALAKLLADESLSSAARYALERMSDPAAGAALRGALGKAKGRALVGVVNSLGHRRDKAAAAPLVRLLAAEDQAVAGAAAWALGRIGGTEAAKALAATRDEVEGRLRRILDDAYLLCADALLADGKQREAAAIYRKMYAADQPRRLRIAALRGLMLAQPGTAGPLALEAMKGPDRKISTVAGALLRDLPGRAITEALAAELPKLPPAGQVTMLAVLAQRSDAAARPAVLAAAGGKDQAVRAAAIAVLGKIGTAKDVPLLVEAACRGSDPLRRAAGVSLARLRGADVEPALVALMKTSPPPVKVTLLGVLSARRAVSAVPEIVTAAGDKDPTVRAAALKALGTLAGRKELPALLGLVLKAATDGDRAAAGKALASACVRAKDKQACAAAVLAAMKDAPIPARCALLRLLPTLPVARSLAAARAAMKDADGKVRDAAARTLAEWPTADVLDDLMAVAAGKNETHKVLALRGCVRVLALPADRPPRKTAALYGRLMELAARPEEKKLVLAGLANVGHVDALKLIEPLLTDAALRAEAQAAAVKVARAVAGADHDLAAATLARIAASGASDRIKQEAAAALRDINKYREYILAWMLSGPYTQKGKSGPDLFRVAFPPEKPGAKDVKWRQVSANAGSAVNLAALLGGENRTAYLRTTIVCPRKQPAMLELGSDDGVKVWLNGKLIHANNASRSLRAGEDKVKITLQAGENTLMLAVINGSTDWGACARIIGPDGKPISGLKVVAK